VVNREVWLRRRGEGIYRRCFWMQYAVLRFAYTAPLSAEIAYKSHSPDQVSKKGAK